MERMGKPGLTKGDGVREAWKESAGPEAAGHTIPVDFKRGTLMVIVDSSPWLYRITMEKKKIIARFNETYKGKKKLENIRMRVGKTDL